MTIEFLGHKKALLDFVCGRIHAVAAPASSGGPVTVADLFCGTGSVSRELKRLGYAVVANDTLAVATVMTEAILANSRAPLFRGLVADLPRTARPSSPPTRYEQVLDFLNGLPPRRGFLWRSYSPASEPRAGVARQYFTRKNAGRLDAIRLQIARWEPALSAAEHALLLSDLLGAANAVSNIAGTYGCYLKHWKDRALGDLKLTRSRFVPRAGPGGAPGTTPPPRHRVFQLPANELATTLRAPIVYADPPYTKRQYAAYYHVLETLVRYDAPTLTGSTGLRPWQDQASDYCYRTRAPAALADLLATLYCEHFFLSYNEDGQIPHAQVLDILGAHGPVKVHETRYRRYRSSAGNHKGTGLTERLYHVALGAG